MSAGMLAAGLMLISAFSHALFNALTKRAEDKLVFRALFLGFSGVLFLPLTFFVSLPTPEAAQHLFISLFIHGIYFYTTVSALKRSRSRPDLPPGPCPAGMCRSWMLMARMYLPEP